MDLATVTPMILTFNEEANIRRTLESVRWARQVVVIDSFSTDKTLSIANEFSNVVIFQRRFDHFAEQCNFGLTKILTEWVLSMDADYQCTQSLQDEISGLQESSFRGFRIGFIYSIHGKDFDQLCIRLELHCIELVVHVTVAMGTRTELLLMVKLLASNRNSFMMIESRSWYGFSRNIDMRYTRPINCFS